MTVQTPAEFADEIKASKASVYRLVNKNRITGRSRIYVPGLRIIKELAIEDLHKKPGRIPDILKT